MEEKGTGKSKRDLSREIPSVALSLQGVGCNTTWDKAEKLEEGASLGEGGIRLLTLLRMCHRTLPIVHAGQNSWVNVCFVQIKNHVLFLHRKALGLASLVPGYRAAPRTHSWGKIPILARKKIDR